MANFKLSAVLEGHRDDVRAVIFPKPSLVVSASRDSTVRQWTCTGDSIPPVYESGTSTSFSASVNSLAFVPPSDRYPQGLIVSGGQDSIIDVRSPSKSPTEDPDALLVGHHENISSLVVNRLGSHIISGSWDSTARIWAVADWEKESVLLEGHGATVWALTTITFEDEELIVTGCADKKLRVYDFSGKLRLEFAGSTEAIRGLCPLPAGNVYNGHFASAGNDCLIQIWALGKTSPIAVLEGHTSFIYSIDVLPTGEIVSSSEDRTVRVWKNKDCIQTITHPAITVWTVAACPVTGDIVTGSSDRIARVFSRDSQRTAASDVLEAFNEANRLFAVPGQTVGDGKINKEKLPGPEFIRSRSGTKEGQVQMIKEDDGSVSAYQWSSSSREWVLVGTVVESAGSSGRKTHYEGKDYDFVFDVDIEDGKPPLKLPYNLSQNPYDAARAFLEKNKLPISYFEATSRFIIENTKGFDVSAPQDDQNQAPSAPLPLTPTPKPSLTLPLTNFLVITDSKLPPIKKKLLELNSNLEDENAKFSGSGAQAFEETFAALEKATTSSSAASSAPIFPLASRNLFLQMASTWPEAQRFPVLDILRLLAAYSPEIAGPVDLPKVQKPSLLSLLLDSDSPAYVFGASAPTVNVFMGLRTITNLFNTAPGRESAQANFDRVVEVARAFIKTSSSPGTRQTSTPDSGSGNATKSHKELVLLHNRDIALATVLLNYAVLFTEKTRDGDKVSVPTSGTQRTPGSGTPGSTGGNGNNGGGGNADSSAANRTMTMVSLLVDLVTQLTYTHDPTDGTGTQPSAPTPAPGQPPVQGQKHMDEALFRALAALGTVLLGSEPVFIELAYDAFNFQALVDAVSEAGKAHPRIAALLKEMESGLKKFRT